jgi:adenylate kinase
LNLLIYGAPGSGKGTQADLLSSRFNVPHIATGDMLRAEVQAGTELGRRAGPIMARGGYVPDDVMIGIIRNRLQQPDTAKGFVMDGFPRTVPQAQALDALMKELGKRYDHVLYLQVDTPELIKRLSTRLVCPACQRTYAPGTVRCSVDGTTLVQREDDKPEAVRLRIDIYLQKTVPVLDYYRNEGLVSEIDGRGTIDEINRRLVSTIGQDGRIPA